MESEWVVTVGDDATRAVLDAADSPEPLGTLILGHGAGSHRDHPTLLNFSRQFRRMGLRTVRFNFLYRELQKGGIDRMPRLMESYGAVIQSVREQNLSGVLLLGGHSMGGRTATMLAADGLRCDGLVLLGYPLHPAGQPEKLRDAHLSAIQDPAICFNGTRDELCEKELMDRVVLNLPRWTMHWVEGADHSFKVQKRSGRTAEEVLEEIGVATQRWVEEAVLPYHDNCGTAAGPEQAHRAESLTGHARADQTGPSAPRRDRQAPQAPRSSPLPLLRTCRSRDKRRAIS